MPGQCGEGEVLEWQNLNWRGDGVREQHWRCKSQRHRGIWEGTGFGLAKFEIARLLCVETGFSLAKFEIPRPLCAGTGFGLAKFKKFHATLCGDRF